VGTTFDARYRSIWSSSPPLYLLFDSDRYFTFSPVCAGLYRMGIMIVSLRDADTTDPLDIAVQRAAALSYVTVVVLPQP